MTNVSELTEFFEADFANFERNRMYPPCHTKESTMIKYDVGHLNALSHAEYWLTERKNNFMGPHQRAETDYDLIKIAEIKSNLISSMKNIKDLFDKTG